MGTLRGKCSTLPTQCSRSSTGPTPIALACLAARTSTAAPTSFTTTPAGNQWIPLLIAAQDGVMSYLPKLEGAHGYTENCSIPTIQCFLHSHLMPLRWIHRKLCVLFLWLPDH